MTAGRQPVAVRRIVTEPLAANCYLVSSASRDAFVLDPGGDADAIAAHVTADDLRVRAVVSTHGHYDHVGAAAELVERYRVPFAIHSAESRALRRVNFFRFAFHRLGRVQVPEIGIDLDGMDHLSFGDLEVVVEHTPGHSPGSVCLEIAGMLFSGDTLSPAGLGRSDLPEADRAALEASARRLARDYPAHTAVHPGHGRPGRLGLSLRGVAAVPGASA